MRECSSLLIIVKKDNEDYLFVQHRDNNPEIRYPNFYSLFGGSKKDDETSEQALKREIKEELDWDLGNENFKFFKTFLWKKDYFNIVQKIQENFSQQALDTIKTIPTDIINLIDNLYVITINKEKAEALKVYEGKKEIISIKQAELSNMIPTDKLMLLDYLVNKNLKKIPFLDLKAQYEPIKQEINEEISWVLDNTSFILGEKVKNFEENFALYCNKKYAIAVNSGTSALHLALLVKGIKPGDEVITVPNTFIATAEAISYTGAKPVFVDINKETDNIDVSKIESKITEKTKAIIPVHLYGQPANMDIIIEIAKKHRLEIIEDCCQAHGAEYNEKKVPITDIGCFSFYPGKNLGAYGEGGMVVTDNSEIAKKIKMLRNHGQEKKYRHKLLGYNYRMDGFQGAILNVKLKCLYDWIEKRRKNAKLYDKLLEGVVEIPKQAHYAKHVYHLYVIKAKQREKLAEYLKSKGIATGMHYPIPLHLQEAYQDLELKKGDYPITEESCEQLLSLPMFPELTEEQIIYITEAIKEFYKNN